MTPRRGLAAMLATTFITWMGQRATAVALPLIALTETGSAWTVGLIGGAVGLPALSSAWWARRLRQRLTSGRAIAGVLVVQIAGVLIVPVTATWGRLTAVHLAAAGIVVGCASALNGPAQRALIADVSDRAGANIAPKMLTWQDFMHRITMIIAPPLAGLAVTAGHTGGLLWAEAAALTAAALLIFGVKGSALPAERHQEAPALRHVLSAYPQIKLAVAMSGVGGLTWFAFSLGLALLGAETGRPGALISAGLTGYGAGSLCGALLAPSLVPRLDPLRTAAMSWIILGGCFAALPWVTGNLIVLGAVAAAGGLYMPLGIGALNSLISTQTSGAERRAAFAAESFVHDGAVSVGLLAGGAIIGLVGAGPTLVVAGLVQITVGALAGPWFTAKTVPTGQPSCTVVRATLPLQAREPKTHSPRSTP